MLSDVLVQLSSTDIPSNLALAHAVGWPDGEPAWHVLYDAAHVVGIRRGAELVATGALGIYEGSGTIAKMIVEPEFQRQKLGARVLDALLAEAERRALGVLGLVATPSGRPLYESRGFVACGEIVVLSGQPRRATITEPLLPPATLTTALAVERRFIPCSRIKLVDACLREPSASAELVVEGQARGYALSTQQANLSLIGPVVAESEIIARSLVSTLFRNLGGAVRIDVPVELTGFRQWLVSLGLRELGGRPEMARGATSLPWQVPQRFALATQAWG